MTARNLAIVPAGATITAADAFKLGSKELAQYIAAGGPDAEVARAEVARREAKRAAKSGTPAPSGAVVRAVLPAPAPVPVPTVAASVAVASVPAEPAPVSSPVPDLTPAPAPAEDEQPGGFWHVAGVPTLAGVTYLDTDTAGRAMLGALQAGAPWSPAVAVRPGRAPGETSVEGIAVLRSEPAPVPAPECTCPIDHPWQHYSCPVHPRTPDPEPAEPTPAPVPAPSGPSFTFDVDAHKRSDVAVARITGDERLILDTFGLALPPPVVELGGVVNETGRDNLRKSHAEWKDEPRTVDTLAAISRAVRAEDRRDVPVLRSDLRMDDEGRLAGMYTEDGGLRSATGLFADTLPGAARVLAVMPAPLRAVVWNEQHARSARLTEAGEPTRAVLRTRRVGTGEDRSLFAVVSDGYTAVDADVVADVTRAALDRVPGGREARGAAVYNPDSTTLRVDALWHADHVHNFGAGDVFKGGIVVKSHDGGGGAIRVEAAFWRNLCYNLIVIGQGRANVARVIHTGDRDSMIRRLAEGIQHVGRGMQPFLQRWGHLRNRDVSSVMAKPSQDSALNLRAVFRAIAGAPVDKDLPMVDPRALPEGVAIDGIRRDTLVEALLSAHRVEGGTSLADVVNAVTRLHSDTRVPVPVVRLAEEAAGSLVLAWGAPASA